MKTQLKSSFARDLKNIKDADVLARVQEAIERVESAADLRDLALTKLQGKGDFYRIRIGDYRRCDNRIGIALEGDEVTFVRCLNRREMYRYFP